MDKLMHIIIQLNKEMNPYLQELRNFRFHFSNPLFGLIILTVFLFLVSRWGKKKAFSYCLLISSILVITTDISARLKGGINHSGLTFADLARAIAGVIIVFISVYYFFVKER